MRVGSSKLRKHSEAAGRRGEKIMRRNSVYACKGRNEGGDQLQGGTQQLQQHAGPAVGSQRRTTEAAAAEQQRHRFHRSL